MSEGHVYPCRWKKTPYGYEVWLEKQPKLNAEGDSLKEALQELGEVVCLATGDGEAAFDLFPPNSHQDKNAYVTLGWNETWSPPADFTRKKYEELYEGGLCKSCCSGIGPRTDKRLSVARLGDGDLLGSGLHMPPALLASERFRGLLKKNVQSLLDWRPIEMHGRSRRVFYEVLAIHPIMAVADRKQRVNGWHCSTCDCRVYGVFSDYENTYIASGDLPRSLPPLLAIDTPHRVQIAIPAIRWHEIRGKLGTKGIVSGGVVCLPDKQAWRKPKLPALTQKGIRARNRELDYDFACLGYKARMVISLMNKKEPRSP